MKNTVLFIVMFSVMNMLSGQIPGSYSIDERADIARYVNQLKKEHDIVIDPIERMPTAPSDYSIRASGNWGTVWTGSKKYYDQLITRSSRPVAVFIFDTEPVFSHHGLSGFAWNEKGKSYTNEPITQDGQGHGTHVAGIIGGLDSQFDIGIAAALVSKGIIKAIPREVLTDAGTGSFSWVAQALEEANTEAVELMQDGWFVVYNLSLGGPGTHARTDNALKAAKQAGIFVCTAAGNTYGEGLEFPARSEGSYAIGSIDNDGKRSSFSTYGEGLFMAAPGRNILSTWKDGSLVELSGTSMATPTQAALVAIAASVYPKLDRGGIEKLLIDVATDIDPADYDPETGYGYNYVGKILDYESDPGEPVPDPDRGERERRILRTILPGPYKAAYQAGGGTFTEVQICDIVIDFRTKQYSEDALADMAKEVEGFFTNRAVTLRAKEDVLDAGYWLNRFLEIHMKKQRDIKVDVVTSCVKDRNGNIGKPTTQKIFDWFTKSIRTTFRY